MSEQQIPDGERLAITSRLIGGVTVLALSGEIDYDSAGRFADALVAVQGPGPQRIVVDFAGVTFMDSTGITALVSAYRALQGADGWIRIAAVSEAALRVIQIVGVDTIIACHPSVDGALEA
ncbi:STAS domain-containing protein [Streptomyces sp. NPDC058305]|uniref:STAS domain-containing protein n=1 Tax=Streptomyces sp. NPDC058305 TaxID=3346438 RepID=UPI0036EC29BB